MPESIIQESLKHPAITSVVGFVFTLALLIVIRAKFPKCEIKPIDLLVAFIPILLTLLVTGKLQKIEVSSSGVKIDAAYQVAQTSTIGKQIDRFNNTTPLPVQQVHLESKSGITDIPKRIDDKTQGLTFQLGKEGYAGEAIKRYLAELTKYPYLECLVVQNSDGTFVGLIDASKFFAIIDHDEANKVVNEFARSLRDSDLESIKKLPDFVGVGDAVKESEEIGHTLKRMEEKQKTSLPVVDGNLRFVGVVYRDRLVSSFLLEVAEYLKDPSRQK